MSIDAGAPYHSEREARMGGVSALAARVRRLIEDRSDTAVAKKVAGGAFLIRVVNAGIAFVSQILLARWMGESEYGVYVYVWTWVLLLGGLTSFGLASSPQRFIPEYAESGEVRLLRGFLLGSRVLSMIFSTVIAAFGILGVWMFADHLDSWAVVPLYLALFCVPMYVLTDVQDGIARSHNWIDVALAPAYFVRPLLILLLLGGLSYQQYAPTATTAMAATIVATWATSVAQLVMLEKRLSTRLPKGPRAYAPGVWMKVSLPIFMVEGFYLLLAYTDVIVLSAFQPPHDVGVYYAAVKVMSLVAFVSFSVSAAVAHRFTEYSVAGDHHRLSRMVRDATRWTFWPSLFGAGALLAVGWPILWLFGESFTQGYPLLFVIAVGLLARAAVGPLERLLNMLGQQNVCAAVYALAFFLNFGICLALVPHFGMMGAAAATSITLVAESALLFVVTRRRLGLGALPWGSWPQPTGGPQNDRETTGDAVGDAVALPFSPVPVGSLPVAKAEPFHFELATIEALAARRADWEDLADRALERNLFCEADFAIAAAQLESVRTVRMAAVWDENRSRLIAVAPVATRRLLPPFRTLVSAHWSYFGALGTPLVDRDRPTDAIEGLLDGLANRGDLMFQFRFLHERGPTADAIRAAAAWSGRSIVRIDGHQRAMLGARSSAEDYLTDSLSAKKLKELRRQLRRLGDDGPVAFREARSPDDVAAALERFLQLETYGWKGKGGSAMIRHADQTAFIRELFRSRAARNEARILELTAGGAVISSGLALISGRNAWFYKIAYDERHARSSPGVQLTIELTKRLIEDPSLDRVDSTAIANHPMIDHVWRERLALGDWIVSARPSANRLLPLAAEVERLRRSSHVALRDLYHRLRT